MGVGHADLLEQGLPRVNVVVLLRDPQRPHSPGSLRRGLLLGQPPGRHLLRLGAFAAVPAAPLSTLERGCGARVPVTLLRTAYACVRHRLLSGGSSVEWNEFVVSEWFWAAAAVAVALAALVGSLATFIGSAISRRLNRPEPEWHFTFHTFGVGRSLIFDGYRGISVSGRAVNIGDGTAFQVQLTDPAGKAVELQFNDQTVPVVPVMRTGDALGFTIITDLGVWVGADSVLSWVDPPTRRRRGGQTTIRPYREHSEPVPEHTLPSDIIAAVGERPGFWNE